MAQDDLSQLKIDRTATRRSTQHSKWTGRKKTAVTCVIVIAALTFGFFFYKPATPVELTEISKVYPAQGVTVLNASGYVVAQRKAAVASKITGRLESLSVEEGSRIKKGEVIARLEAEDARAACDQAAANLNVSKHNLDQARAELVDSRANFNRADELIKKGYISRSDYDAAQARYLKAQAAVDAADAGVKANAAALKAAQTNVEYALIRAPFDAVVLTKNADVGDIVTPLGAAANAKSAVVSIADMGSLQVEADVSESNVEKVSIGQPCEVQLDAIPEKRFRGTVHMIVPTADRNKASIMVKVRFLETSPRILPDMSAKVAFLKRDLTPDERMPRTGVSERAIVQRGGKTILFIVGNGSVAEASVRTGKTFGGMVEILDGAKIGDKVVINPPAKLMNGSRVRPADK